VPATVTSALLTFNTGSEAGHGSVLLSAGSHSDWNERSFNDTWSQEKRYGLPFDHALIGTEKATLVMEMAQGSSGMSIISSVSNNEPRLQLTGPASFCAEYEENQKAKLVEPEPEPVPETDTEQRLDVPDTDVITNSIPESETESDGGGSIQLLELLILTSLLSAVHVRRRRF